MSDDWKDKPHWVLRFSEMGNWELVGPDGAVKSIDGLGQRRLAVNLEMQNVPLFDMHGILSLKPK